MADDDKIDLSGHRANLRELGAFHTGQQVSPAAGVNLESGLEHVQGSVPVVLVASVERELEMHDVERQVRLGDAAIGRMVSVCTLRSTNKRI